MENMTKATDDALNELGTIGDLDTALVAVLKNLASLMDAKNNSGIDVPSSYFTEYRRTLEQIKANRPESVGVDEDDEFLSPQDA